MFKRFGLGQDQVRFLHRGFASFAQCRAGCVAASTCQALRPGPGPGAPCQQFELASVTVCARTTGCIAACCGRQRQVLACCC
jgi:hypothetical protein